MGPQEPTAPKARSAAHPCLQLPGEVLLPVSAGLLAARVARALLPKSSQGESCPRAPGSLGLWDLRGGEDRVRGLSLLSALPGGHPTPAAVHCALPGAHRRRVPPQVSRLSLCLELGLLQGFLSPNSLSGAGNPGG